MSLVTFVYNQSFCSVVSDGLRTTTFGDGRAECFQKFLVIEDTAVVGLAGHFPTPGDGSIESIFDMCKDVLKHNTTRKGFDKIIDYIERLPFDNESSSVKIAIVKYVNDKLFALQASNNPDISSVNTTIRDKDIHTISMGNTDEFDSIPALDEFLESKTLNSYQQINAFQKEYSQLVSNFDTSVNDRTLGTIIYPI